MEKCKTLKVEVSNAVDGFKATFDSSTFSEAEVESHENGIVGLAKDWISDVFISKRKQWFTDSNLGFNECLKSEVVVRSWLEVVSSGFLSIAIGNVGEVKFFKTCIVRAS